MKNKSVKVVRWETYEGEIKQCLNETVLSDFDTLCCSDLNDEWVAKRVIAYKTGQVTCPQCLNVIKGVLKHFSEQSTQS